MRHLFVVPDGCYRPNDLHPLSLAKDGRCTVTMIRKCFLKRNKRQHPYTHVMTGEESEAQLECVFQDLGYKDNEYPFEQGWHHDGCTSKMSVGNMGFLAFVRRISGRKAGATTIATAS